MTTRRTKTPPTASPARTTTQVRDATTIDLGKVAATIDAKFADADAARVTAYARLAQLQTARASVLARGRATVAADDRASYDAAIEAATSFSSALMSASVVASLPTPSASADETVVHGVVEGADAGVKLTLHDASGATIATGSTKANGAFALHFTTKAAASRLELRVHDQKYPAPFELDVPDKVNLAIVKPRS